MLHSLEGLRRGSLVTLALVVLGAGCTCGAADDADPEDDSILGTPTSSRAYEVPDEPGEAVGQYAERHTGPAPRGARCPESITEPCVSELEGYVFVSAPGWDHHYRLDLNDENGAIRRGAETDLDWMRHLEAGVRDVLAEEAATSAVGHCGLAGEMPALYGAPNGYFRVPIPTVAEGEPPAPVTPAQANDTLQAAYTRIGYPTDSPRTFFEGPLLSRMTATTFLQPIVTRRGAFLGDGTTVKEALVFVVFSPESSRVYVLDRSREFPPGEPEQTVRQRQLDDQAALLRLLSGIGESPIAFAADTACEIPELVGGRPWRLLSPPWHHD
ncbi:MAG: hypothetical protein AB7P00_42000 [Sandaracinaceae bacterium]